ncbi:MAG TPA: DapH/DapD/GlmU-related protein [Acidimicrobiales bacterium]|nr:DapH/DapD/GlmU-related protein [Acidimicrobiales bacterium]
MTSWVEPQFLDTGGSSIEAGAVVGHPYEGWRAPARLGRGCTVRTGTVIYADTVLGDHTSTGVNALIREHTHIGHRGLIGSATIIEGHVVVGDDVALQSGVFLPTQARLGDRVFVGPRAVLTNDRYPLRRRQGYRADGPVLEDDVSVGANATVLPGVRIGEGAMVAAGAVVTRDVPAWALAVGNPARVRDLPADLREQNAVRRR